MKFKRSQTRRIHAEVTMTPMIDMFLNILIFFLVTTTFSQDSVFFVELPEATASQGEETKKQIVIAVGADGRIAVDGKEVELDTLVDQLAKIPTERRKTLPVVMRADQGSLHGRVVSVIDIVRRTGFENIGIATKVPTKIKD